MFIEGYLKDDELVCLNYSKKKCEAVKADNKLPILSDTDIINNQNHSEVYGILYIDCVYVRKYAHRQGKNTCFVLIFRLYLHHIENISKNKINILILI